MSDDETEEERTLQIRAGLNANAWWPVSLSVTRTVTKRWKNRISELAAESAHHAGLDADQIAVRVEDDERVGDLVMTASERAGQTADSSYRSALARLIAAGLRDDAQVDQAAYYLAILVALEPVHLRVLKAVADHTPLSGRPVDVGKINNLRVGKTIAYSAAQRLRALGLLESMWDDGGTVQMGDGVALLTPAGREFLAMCEAIDATEST